MSTTKTFRNTDERFGACIKIEGKSAEAIADEMMPILRDWADEQERDVADLRDEFIDALVEETTGPAAEVFGLTVHQRGAEYAEFGDGHGRYICEAAALDLDVTVEADNEDAQRESYDKWSLAWLRDPADFDLIDSNDAVTVSAVELGIDDEEYARLVRESMLSSAPEGHVLTSNGRRVYAH